MAMEASNGNTKKYLEVVPDDQVQCSRTSLTLLGKY